MVATLSELFKDHPAHLNRILPLDFDSVRSVPDSHRWPSCGSSRSGDDLPCLPLVDLEAPDASVHIVGACESWGAFQVINHGIPLDVIDDVEMETRRLFSLPAKQKLKVLRSPNGATGYGVARIAPFYDKFMWHEGFTLIGCPVKHASALWPNNHTHFCDAMVGYQGRVNDLVSSILRLIFKSLQLPCDGNEWLRAVQSSTQALQLNSYPVCPDPSGTMGLAPHTDTSLLTVLHQNHVAGLQVFKQGVGWCPVKPTRGALVVNVGDLLHILSNGRLHSVLHRVVMEEADAHRQRLSVASFTGLPVDTELCPIIVPPEQIPKYRKLLVAEYAGIKATCHDKALSSIALY